MSASWDTRAGTQVRLDDVWDFDEEGGANLGSEEAGCSFCATPNSFNDFLATIILFISGCAGSSLLCELFSSCGEWGLLSTCSAWASHCGGFSSCRARPLGCTGFSSCDLWAR